MSISCGVDGTRTGTGGLSTRFRRRGRGIRTRGRVISRLNRGVGCLARRATQRGTVLSDGRSVAVTRTRGCRGILSSTGGVAGRCRGRGTRLNIDRTQLARVNAGVGSATGGRGRVGDN